MFQFVVTQCNVDRDLIPLSWKPQMSHNFFLAKKLPSVHVEILKNEIQKKINCTFNFHKFSLKDLASHFV
jgi:hypothetical protein